MITFGYKDPKNSIWRTILALFVGIILLFNYPAAVAGVIVRLIGIGLVVFGALQLIVLSGAMSLVGMGKGSLLLSVVAIIGGCVLLFNPFGLALMRFIAGVALVCYGLSELLSRKKVEEAKEEYEIRFNKKDDDADKVESSKSSLDDVKDVEYRKED